MEKFDPRWLGFLCNPVWYVATVSCLAGVTYYLHGWWGLTGGVALIWGLWLVWYSFGQDKNDAGAEEQLQDWLDQALCYKIQIQQALKHTESQRVLSNRPALSTQVNTWVDLIQDLVQRLASLRQDKLIQQELLTVPLAIEALKAQLTGTADGALRAQLEQTLANRQNQLALLRGLQRTMTQAEIQIEHTLSLLSTVYSQILTGQSIQHVASYGRFLSDVDEEVRRLQDQLEALREVKGATFIDLSQPADEARAALWFNSV